MSQIRVQTNKLCQAFRLGSLLAADVGKRRFKVGGEEGEVVKHSV